MRLRRRRRFSNGLVRVLSMRRPDILMLRVELAALVAVFTSNYPVRFVLRICNRLLFIRSQHVSFISDNRDSSVGFEQ